MSKAKPMDAEHRALNYTEILNPDGEVAGYHGRVTPRQRRRYRHKLRRQLGTFLAGDGHYPGDPAGRRLRRTATKGRPTPRQRKRASGA